MNKQDNLEAFGELFREDRFGVRVIQRTMFDDENLKCLRSFLGQLLKDTISHDKPLTVRKVRVPFSYC